MPVPESPGGFWNTFFGVIIILIFVVLTIFIVFKNFYDKYVIPYKSQLKNSNSIREKIIGVIVISVLIYLAYFYGGKDQFLKFTARDSLIRGTTI